MNQKQYLDMCDAFWKSVPHTSDKVSICGEWYATFTGGYGGYPCYKTRHISMPKSHYVSVGGLESPVELARRKSKKGY